MKKLLALLTVLAALSVTACGSEGSDAIDDTDSAATASGDAEALCIPGPSNPSCCEYCPSVAFCQDSTTGSRIPVRSSCSSWDSMRMCQSLIASGRCLSCTMGGSMGTCHKK